MLPASRSGFLLGRGVFLCRRIFVGSRSLVPVWLGFNVDKLPFPDIPVNVKRSGIQGDDRDLVPGDSLARTDSAICSQDDRGCVRRA